MTIKNYVCAGLVGLFGFNVNECPVNLYESIKKKPIHKKHLGDAVEYHKKLSYQKIIEKMKVPVQVEWYLQNYLIPHEHPGNVKSFKKTHQERFADCMDATLASAIMLYGDGYEPNYLVMWKSSSKIGHAVFYYEKNGLYGSLGINKEDCNEPKFKTLNNLVDKLGYEKFCKFKVNKDSIISSKEKDQRILFSKLKKSVCYDVKKQ